MTNLDSASETDIEPKSPTHDDHYCNANIENDQINVEENYQDENGDNVACEFGEDEVVSTSDATSEDQFIYLHIKINHKK